MEKYMHVIRKIPGFKIISYNTADKFLREVVISTQPITIIDNGIVYELRKDSNGWRMHKQHDNIDNYGGSDTLVTKSISSIARTVYWHRKQINKMFFSD